MATRTTKHINGVAAPSLNAADLLALIVKERKKDVDAVPPGFLTVEQWSKAWNLERTRTKQLLHYAVEQGLADRQTFRIMCGIKRCPVAHFKQLKKA